MSMWNRHNRPYLLCVVLSLLIFICQVSYLLLPALLHYMDQQNAVQELTLIQSYRKWHENYLQLKEEKDTKANYLKGLESELLYEDELDLLPGIIHQISLVAKTELTRFRPGPVLSEIPYIAQKTQIYLKGSFFQVIHSMQLLQKLQIYQQLNFVIQPHEEQLLCTIDLQLYYKPGKRGGSHV